MYVSDTIAAIATPPGRGGIGVIRISGPLGASILRTLTGALPSPRYAAFSRFRDTRGEVIDEGLALYFPGPKSFTGEDVVELQGHGGPVVMDMLLESVCALGARLAKPGEFSERAFLNDRMDLAQAEAVADLIDAGSRSAARAAVRSLDGAFSWEIQTLADQVLRLRVYVEAAIDFPDEEVDFLSDGVVSEQIETIESKLEEILTKAGQGQTLRDGLNVVILGRPNAGKSSLLNRLAGRESAIVTHIPGTTRDVLREFIHLGALPLHVIDTAGLRDSDDPVEREGIRRALAETEAADHVLLMFDDRESIEPDELLNRVGNPNLPITLLINKLDLSGRKPGPVSGFAYPAFAVSAKHGEGMDAFVDYMERTAGLHRHGEGLFLARRRHLQALTRAQQHVTKAKEQLLIYEAGELVAEELFQAHDALGEITGKVNADDLLGEIFSNFCIGK